VYETEEDNTKGGENLLTAQECKTKKNDLSELSGPKEISEKKPLLKVEGGLEKRKGEIRDGSSSSDLGKNKGKIDFLCPLLETPSGGTRRANSTLGIGAASGLESQGVGLEDAVAEHDTSKRGGEKGRNSV